MLLPRKEKETGSIVSCGRGREKAIQTDGFFRMLWEGREPEDITNKKRILSDALFLVDDIGLEPMTFRTSSGCSSQLS